MKFVQSKVLNDFIDQRNDKIKQLKQSHSLGEGKSFFTFLLILPLMALPFLLLYLTIGQFGHLKEFQVPKDQFKIYVLSALVIFLIFKVLLRKSYPKVIQTFEEISLSNQRLFHPFERTAIICYDMANDFKRLSLSKVRDDLGLGASEDDMEAYYREMLVGRSELYPRGKRRPYDQTNCFFMNINNEKDIRDKLFSLGVTKNLVKADTYSNLYFIYCFLIPGGGVFSGDYKIAFSIFEKLGEAFVYAFNKNFNQFSKGLNEAVALIKRYKLTKTKLVGIPFLCVSIFNYVRRQYVPFLLRLGAVLLCIISCYLFIILFPNFLIKKFPALISMGLGLTELELIAATVLSLFPVLLKLRI